MSVYYCIGNLGIKRKTFKEVGALGVCADNDDVLATFSLSGKLYCLLGKLPFQDMYVRDYIAYQRALIKGKPLSDKEIKFILLSVGDRTPLYRKIKKLTRVQFRHLQIAAKWSAEVKSLYVNLDGLNFCKKNLRQVNKLVNALKSEYELHLAISDSRFIPSGSFIKEYTQDGAINVLKPAKQFSVSAPKRILAKFFKNNKNADLDFKSVQGVVQINRA